MNKLQDSVSLKRLLNNPDFIKYTKEVENFYAHENAIVQSYTKKFISKDKLDELNYHMACRNALGSMLIAKSALEDDLADTIDAAVEKDLS